MRMGDLLQSCVNTENVYTVVRRFAVELFPEQSGALYQFDPALNMLEFVVTWEENRPNSSDFLSDDCWGLQRNRIQIGDGNTELHCKHIPPDRQFSYLCVPMTVQTETVGLFHLCSADEYNLEQLTQVSQMFAGRVRWLYRTYA